MRSCLRTSSFCNAKNPGAGSTLIMAGGPSSGCRPTHKRASASRSISYFSLSIIQAVAKEVTDPRSSSTNYLLRLSTSAANDTPTVSVEFSDDCFTKVFGNVFNDAHVWHESDTRSIALFKSSAKK